jgi:hypothetical protein
MTQVLGIPVVLGFAVVAYVSLLTGLLPKWTGIIAIVAETWSGSFFLRRIRSLRKL